MLKPVLKIARQSQSNLFVKLAFTFFHAASNDRSDKIYDALSRKHRISEIGLRWGFNSSI
jgi:hypothetical protein